MRKVTKRITIFMLAALFLSSTVWVFFAIGYQVGVLSGLKVDFRTTYADTSQLILLLKRAKKQGVSFSGEEVNEYIARNMDQLRAKKSVIESLTISRMLIEPVTSFYAVHSLYSASLPEIAVLEARFAALKRGD